jgi:hypothetical protein
VAVEEFVAGATTNFMAAREVGNLSLVTDFETCILPLDPGIFPSDHFIDSNTVVVAAFHHEWPRSNKIRHFGVVESVAKVEFRHFVFESENVAARIIGKNILADPLVEVS